MAGTPGLDLTWSPLKVVMMMKSSVADRITVPYSSYIFLVLLSNICVQYSTNSTTTGMYRYLRYTICINCNGTCTQHPTDILCSRSPCAQDISFTTCTSTAASSAYPVRSRYDIALVVPCTQTACRGSSTHDAPRLQPHALTNMLLPICRRAASAVHVHIPHTACREASTYDA
jgi:hypothetical protein